MRTLLNFLLVFLYVYCTPINAQPIVSDSSLIITPKFEIGETKYYLVNEICKIDNFIIPVNAKHKFQVSFKVLDTSMGYTIAYTPEIIETSNKRFIMESAKAEIIDDMTFTYKLNRKGEVVEFLNYEKCQLQVIEKLDSIISISRLSKMDLTQLLILRKNLSKPDGLEIVLSPLVLFNSIFTKPMFRNHKDYHAGRLSNLFNQPNIAGTMILDIKKNNQPQNYSTVSVDFIGNRDSAAKYFTPVYKEMYTELSGKQAKFIPDEMKLNIESEYEIMLSSGWPVNIEYKRTEFYTQRYVSKVTMEIIE